MFPAYPQHWRFFNKSPWNDHEKQNSTSFLPHKFLWIQLSPLTSDPFSEHTKLQRVERWHIQLKFTDSPYFNVLCLKEDGLPKTPNTTLIREVILLLSLANSRLPSWIDKKLPMASLLLAAKDLNYCLNVAPVGLRNHDERHVTSRNDVQAGKFACSPAGKHWMLCHWSNGHIATSAYT